MMNILSIQTSISGNSSVTRSLSNTYIESLRANTSDISIIEHDLVTNPLPHLDGSMLSTQLGMNVIPTQATLLSDQLISELERCDILLLGSPMYNFAIPSSLKAWFDHIIRAGRTFHYKDGKPEGLLPSGKKAIVFSSSGGVYSEGAGKQIDFLEPHLRWLLTFVGITEVVFIRAEGMAHGADAVATAMSDARAQTLDLVANIQR